MGYKFAGRIATEDIKPNASTEVIENKSFTNPFAEKLPD